MVRHGQETNRLDFGTDPDLELNLGSIFPLFQY